MKLRTRAEQAKQDEYPEDLLTEVLRKGARDLLAQAVEEEVTAFLPRMLIFVMTRDATCLYSMAIYPTAPFKPALGASRSEDDESAINGRFRRPTTFSLPLRSCLAIFDGVRAWRS